MENQDKINVRMVGELPEKYRSVFSEFPCFNLVQSQIIDDALYTDNSIVVSAPTGSGKTTIFELAIVRLLMKYEHANFLDKFKIIYISPTKALCQEKVLAWQKKFSIFGLSLLSVTGDSDKIEFRTLLNYNLIISTPEKWDALTRKWRDNEALVKTVKLFMIDEVHLLNADIRGSTLEVIVSRMKTVEINQDIRFVAASATVPNGEDVAKWIGNCRPKTCETKYFKFSEDMRPVQLKKIVHGYPFNTKTHTVFKFDMYLNFRLPSMILQYAERKPTLIFCNTRKSVEMTAKFIFQNVNITLNAAHKDHLSKIAMTISDKNLRDMMVHGFGYHHAGMLLENRRTVEELFREGQLPVLVTTSALALGVNLPAHLVIIKNTKQYVMGGGVRDYDESEILQMIGRAGRPQYDTSATAIILTTNDDKIKFEKMVSSQQPIESNLHKHLTEHLNAEIVLRTITDLGIAMKWVSSTFLYVRAMKNPKHYNLPVGLEPDQIDKKILEIFQIHLNKLVKGGMATMDQNIVISPTVIGQIMAKYYVDFETMKLFTQISGDEVMTQILAMISKCQEFSEIHIRSGDKKCLNILNKNSKKETIRFPLSGKIKTLNMKINCIMQAVMGNLEIYDQSILSDSIRIMRTAERMSRCLIEYLETRSDCYTVLLNSIILAKCFHAKLWENSQYVAKQLTGIGSVMSHQLVNAGKTSFAKILETNPREIEMILKRKPPIGSAIIDEVKYLPQYKMSLEKSKNKNEIIVTITLCNSKELQEKCTISNNSTMTLLVGENCHNKILLYEKYEHSYLIQNPHIVKTVDLNNIETDKINANLISEDWVGIDCSSEVIVDEVLNKYKSGSNKLEKKNANYMQTFLDVYMKSKKNIPERTSDAAKKISSEKKTADKPKINKQNSKTIPQTPGAQKKCKSKLSTQKINTLNNFIKTNNPQNLKASKPQEISEYKLIEIKDTNNSEQNENSKDITEIKSSQCSEASNGSLFSEKLSTVMPKSNNFTKNINPQNFNPPTAQEISEYKIIEIKDSNNTDKNENSNDVTKIQSSQHSEASNTSLFSDKLSATMFESEMCKLVDDVQNDFKKHKENIKLIENEQQNYEKSPKNLHSADSTNMENKQNINLFQHLSNINLESIKQKYNTYNPPQCSQKLKINPVIHKIVTKNKNKKDLSSAATEFEDLLSQQRSDENIALDRFRMNHKKFTHNSEPPDSTVNERITLQSGQILVPAKKPKLELPNNRIMNEDNFQKSIKWRSPLVYSPPVKYSPKLSMETISEVREEINGDAQNDTMETFNSASTEQQKVHKIRSPWHAMPIPTEKQPTFMPLSDKDCNSSPRGKLKDMSDICSTSFMEDILKDVKTPVKADSNIKNEYKKTSAAEYFASQRKFKQNVLTQKEHSVAMNSSKDLNLSLNKSREVEHDNSLSDSQRPRTTLLTDNRNFVQNEPLFSRNTQQTVNEEYVFNSPRYVNQRNVPFSQNYRRQVLPASEIDFIDDFMPINYPNERRFSNYTPQYIEPRRVLTPRYYDNCNPYYHRPEYVHDYPYSPRIYRQNHEFLKPYPNIRENMQVSEYFRNRGEPRYQNFNESQNIMNRSLVDNQENNEPSFYPRNRLLNEKKTSQEILEYSASQSGYEMQAQPNMGPILRSSNNKADISNMMKRNLSFNENEQPIRNVRVQSFEDRFNGMMEPINIENNVNFNRSYGLYEEKRPQYHSQMNYNNFSPMVNREVRPYNDKQYVMNKYLHSMDQ